MFIFTLLVPTIIGLAPLEPESKILFGAWIDTSPQKDSPVQFNQRLSIKASFFQFSQNLPLDFSNPPPVRLIDDTNTNAILYLTVYPTQFVDTITDQSIQDLVSQIAGFTKKGRSVFIRLAPEMNGSWFIYAQKPVEYIAFWRRVVAAVRANAYTGKKVAFVWGPNYAFGYPFPGGQYSLNASTGPDFDALDTNKNGRFDQGDDPYSPYYPGDDQVDWCLILNRVGLSAYYFGQTYPWQKNEMPKESSFSDLLRGANMQGGIDFYSVYAESKNKPFMVTESGASFHVSYLANPAAILDKGAGEVAIKQSFWREYITNPNIQSAFPNLKAICLFEFEKPEELTLRDFRVSSGAPQSAFVADLSGVLGNYVFADDISTSAPPSPGTKNDALHNNNAGKFLFNFFAGSILFLAI